MRPFHFDPFRSRLARDIRNNLAKSFLQALAEKDASVFHRCGAAYLQQHPGPGYAGYVKSRLAKYKEAFAMIEQGQSREVLQQAAIFWDLELYFEMHELLELEWKAAGGERRMALQGLIRAAGMKIHAENNNFTAAANMGAKALAAVVKYRQELVGFVRYEAVLAEIRQMLGRSRSNHQG